jgi:hypothetical protein
MPAKCATLETIALNREIRMRIGQRLREHYDLAQRIPLPARLAELANQFGQPIEHNEGKLEDSALSAPQTRPPKVD